MQGCIKLELLQKRWRPCMDTGLKYVFDVISTSIFTLNAYVNEAREIRAGIVSKFQNLRHEVDTTEQTALREFDSDVRETTKRLRAEQEVAEVFGRQAVVCSMAATAGDSHFALKHYQAPAMPRCDGNSTFVVAGLQSVHLALHAVCIARDVENVWDAELNALKNMKSMLDAEMTRVGHQQQETCKGLLTRRMLTPTMAPFQGRKLFSWELEPVVAKRRHAVAISPDGSMAAIAEFCRDSIYMVAIPSGKHQFTIGRRGLNICGLENISAICFCMHSVTKTILVAQERTCALREISVSGDHIRYIGKDVFTSDHSIFGVAASSQVIVAGQESAIFVFGALSGTLICRFYIPRGKCVGLRLMPCGTLIGVADNGNYKVSVHTITGKFVRHLGQAYVQDVAFLASSEAVIVRWDTAQLFTPLQGNAHQFNIDCEGTPICAVGDVLFLTQRDTKATYLTAWV